MVKTRQLVAVTCLAAVFSICAHAQDVSNYLFLEVVDSNEAPLKDATVTLIGPWSVIENPEEAGAAKRTDSWGEVRFDLGHFASDYSKSIFKISKPGYFDFFDLGIFIRPRDQTRVKFELLRVPETEAEKKTIGNEQVKREFFWAAKRGEAGKVRNFLKQGLSANLKTDDLRGVSAPKDVPVVLFAATSGDSETVKVLLKARANVRSEMEPLHSILGYYLAANPTLKAQNGAGNLRKQLVREYQKGISSLFKAGAATHDMFGVKGMNALMFAAKQNDAESVGRLIKLGMPVNENLGGQTALMWAVDQYFYNYPGYSPLGVAEVLLKAGADPNIGTGPETVGNCRSPLMQAVFGGDLELVKLLIKYGADVNFTCKNGDNAFRRSQRYSVVNEKNQKEMIKILEAAGAH